MGNVCLVGLSRGSSDASSKLAEGSHTTKKCWVGGGLSQGTKSTTKSRSCFFQGLSGSGRTLSSIPASLAGLVPYSATSLSRKTTFSHAHFLSRRQLIPSPTLAQRPLSFMFQCTQTHTTEPNPSLLLFVLSHPPPVSRRLRRCLGLY